MEAVRDFGEWLWRIRQAEHSQCGGRGEHRQSSRQIMPERIDRIRLSALEPSDLVFILDIVLCAREVIELPFEGNDLALVDTAYPELRQRVPGQVLERSTVELGVTPQGGCRQIQGNAGLALDLRQRLELLQRRNIDM